MTAAPDTREGGDRAMTAAPDLPLMVETAR